MRHITHIVVPEARVQAAWQAQVAAAGQLPGLQSALVGRHRELFPRFAATYTQLRVLPRRVRRALQRRFGLPLASLALWLALGQLPALAATITVGGSCTLVDAITVANTDTATGGCRAGQGADTIVLPVGSTQTLTRVDNETYGPMGLPVITSVITIAGQGGTIVRDSGAPDFRLLAVMSTGDLTLQETTVTGGSAGGGVANGGTLTVTNSTITGNSAGGGGGGVSNGFNAYCAVTNSTIAGNSAAGDGGGVVNNGYLTVTNSTIAGNSAAGDGGGGVANGGTLTVTNSTITGNSAAGDGGGGVANGGTLTVTNSTITGNSAAGDGGGVVNGGTLTVTNSTIAGNSAGGDGGGVSNGFYAYCAVTNSTIAGNSAAAGGGVANDFGYLTVTNSTITGNDARYGGGGILSVSRLARTLISGNTAPTGPEVFNDRAVVADSHNLFGVDGDAGVVGFSPDPTDVVPPAGVLLPDILNPTLADNGGPTQTLALVPGSPAIDAAGPVCFDANGAPLTMDQRGQPRPVDGNGDGLAACDIGAIEFQSQGPVVQAANGRAERLGTANAKVTLEGRVTGGPLADLNLGASTVTITSILNEAGVELVAGANLPLTFVAHSGSDADGATFGTPGAARPKFRLDLSHRGEEVVSFRLVVEFAPSEQPTTCDGMPRTTELTTSFQLDPGPVIVTTTQPWQCLAGGSQLRVPVP